MATDFWFKFKFKDYLADTRVLSVEARGLLVDIIIYMESNKTFFIKNDPEFLIRLTGITTEKLTKCITEFKNFGTLNFEQNENFEQIIVSRKIKKDLQRSRINAENGKNGGNPRLKKEVRLTDSDNRNDNQTHNRTSNSIFISDKEEGIVKGVQGEKEREKNPDGSLPNISDEQIAAIPEIVERFSEQCLSDFRFHDSLRQKNHKLKTDEDCRRAIKAFAAVQSHGLEYYWRIQNFKQHMLRSPVFLNFDPGNEAQNKSMIAQNLQTYEEVQAILRAKRLNQDQR